MGGMQENRTESISLDDVDHDSFLPILYFIYTDKLPPSADEGATINIRNENVDINTALDAIPVASMFRLESLLKLCEEVVMKGVSTETVAYVWRIAKTYLVPNLQKHCEEMIKKEQWDVTESPYWMSLTVEEREEVISSLITPAIIRDNYENKGKDQPPPKKVIDETPIPTTLNITGKFTADELRKMLKSSVLPLKGFDKTKAEQYLGEAEFIQIFGTTSAKFSELPKWRQDLLKKQAQLF
eukprot:Phypoly_transcript_16158.p1 GENE.Phypoly_transcript_16158~~Phypoly_transcript_16158.p1  ORF type:complete len:276 (+),score=44.08 Phypoly_transcript_16158:106-828(+)